MTSQIPINLYPREAQAFNEARLSLIIRPLDPQPELREGTGIAPTGWCWGPLQWWPSEEAFEVALRKHCPFGAAGAKLWGKEAWKPVQSGQIKPKEPRAPEPGENLVSSLKAEAVAYGEIRDGCTYRADGTTIWRPFTTKIHVMYEASDDKPRQFRQTKWRAARTMPSWAIRFRYLCQSVRVVRVADITNEDALLAGITPREATELGIAVSDSEEEFNFYEARGVFRAWWDATYAKRGLGIDQNPWCWFVEVREAKK